MFIVIGTVGAILLLSALVFDDVFDELVPDIDFISGIVIGAAAACFGLFGWYADNGLGLGGFPALAIAAVAALITGWLVTIGTRALLNRQTDATPTTESLVGVAGRVVTSVKAGGIGEILIDLGGTATKYTATAEQDIPAGAKIVVIAVESPTKVRIESESSFWS